jgi:hypothetical protein
MAIKKTIFAGGQTGVDNSRSINAAISAYKEFAEVARSDAVRILRGVGRIILDSTIPFVPLQTGALRESGRFNVERTRQGARLVISFGGGDYPVTPTENAPTGFVDYAVLVHEDLTRNYKVGGPKFLDLGIGAARTQFDQYVVDEFRKLAK